jgi:hypothetical protein
LAHAAKLSAFSGGVLTALDAKAGQLFRLRLALYLAAANIAVFFILFDIIEFTPWTLHKRHIKSSGYIDATLLCESLYSMSSSLLTFRIALGIPNYMSDTLQKFVPAFRIFRRV